MQTLKQKFSNLLHRHPWVLQFSLATVIATIAIGSSLNVNWAKAFTLPPIILPDIVVVKPAPQAVWSVGSTENIEIRFLRDVTTSYNVRVVLCQNNPGMCLDDEIVDTTNVTIGPATAGTSQVIGTWAQVGYKLDGTIIPGDFASYSNNTVISLSLTEVGVGGASGRHVNSGVFSIVRGIVIVPLPYVSTDGPNVRLGEVRPVHVSVLGPIDWGPADSEGYTGSIALYLMNNDQQMLTATRKVKPLDFYNTAGIVFEHLFGSVPFRLGYPADRDYWFKAIVHYDNSIQGGGAGEFSLESQKFKIDPAGYTIAFTSPAADGSTVWPVDSVQQLSYRVTPKPGITEPFRVENQIGLYLDKVYFGERQTLVSINPEIRIPAGFDTSNPLGLTWAISKADLYDRYNLADTDLWISAHIATTFSGENYISGKFRLVDALGDPTVKFTVPAQGDTIYLGNIYPLNFLRTPDSEDPMTLVLQGEGGLNQKHRKILADAQSFIGGLLTWAWDTNYFTDPEYGFYHNAYGSGTIFALDPVTDNDFGQSGTFQFERLVKFTPTLSTDEPMDGTFQWPGAMPPILEYTAGTTQAVSYWVDPIPTHWINDQTVTAPPTAYLYLNKNTESDWELLNTQVLDKAVGDYTYNWQIPADSSEFNGKLMVVVSRDGSIPNPTNPRYYAVTYPFLVTPSDASTAPPRLVLKPNPNISVAAGATFPVDVYLEPAAGQSAGGFKYSLVFDPTYLEAESVETHLFFHMGGQIDNQAGTITAEDYMEYPGGSLTEETLVSTITFRAKTKTGTTNVNFDEPTNIIKNYIATLGGNVALASAQDTSVTIGSTGSNPFSATYYSPTFDLTTNGVGPTALGGLKAVWHELPAIGANVRFSIGFFKRSGDIIIPVFHNNTSGLPSGTFDSEGYHTISDANEEALIDPYGTGYLMSWLQSHPQFSEIESVRIRILMDSPNITDTDLNNQPWVQSVNLDYTAVPDANEIGVISFVATGSEPIPGIQTVSLGQTALFKVKATAYEAADFVGEVQFGLGAIVPAGSGLVGLPNPVTGRLPINDLDNDSTSDNESGIMEYAFDTTGVAPGAYTLTFTGHDSGANGGNSARTFREAIGQLTITDTSAGFEMAVSPATQAVVKGQSINYTITVVRHTPFAGTITLTTSDIAATFGTGVTATLSDTTLTALETTSILTIATTANAQAPQTGSFTVNGQADGETDQVASGQLSIVAAEDALTLTLTIPVEGGKPTDTTLLHPRFSVKIYDSTTGQLARTGLATDAQNRLTIVATRAELPSKTYTIYARSDRHLWSKSTVPATLVIDDTTAVYNITFPTLKAGDLDANNKVNNNDLNIDDTWSKYSQMIPGLLGDFNNDGKINMADLSFIVNFNYSLWGDRLPDEIR